MASLNFFTQDGNLVKRIQKDTLPKGTIDYIGGGEIIMCNTTHLKIIQIVGKDAHQVKTLITFAGAQGRGIAVNASKMWNCEGCEDDSFFNCHQAYLTYNITGPIIYAMTAVDFNTGQPTTNTYVPSGGDIMRGVTFDGQAIWAARGPLAGGNALDRIDISDRNSAHLTKTYSSVNNYPDLTFNGMDLVLLGNVNVQYKDPAKGNNPPKKVWAHSRSNVAGICFDGEHVIISSD